MISLIATVFNEQQGIVEWLDSLLHQTVSPDEMVIVDGGSTDGTWELLLQQANTEKKLRVYQAVGNIAHGRNTAIHLAAGDLIIVADAGCVYKPNWIETISRPLIHGLTKASTTGFGPWLKQSDTLLTYLIAAATIPAPNEFKKTWYASSRTIAFSKQLWKEVGGYPEWIPICEDVLFDLSLMNNTPMSFDPSVMVLWRPRTTLASYLRQLFLYTKGDGHGQLFIARQWVRMGMYLLGVCLIGLGLEHPYVLILLVIGVAGYCLKFWKRWFSFTVSLPWTKKLFGAMMLPLIVGVGDLSKMAGWPVGVWQRITGKVRPSANQ